MSKFTASNGVEIRVEGDFSGDIYLTGKAGGSLVATGNLEGIEALREFFQHERDKELGRWRWPENPDMVVQADEGGERAWVVNERNQQITGWMWRVDLDLVTAPAQVVAAARAYFDAHPQSKPWHDAKPGEVWVITTRNVANEVAVQRTPGGRWQYNDGILFEDDDLVIKTGRRIWPEDSNDS